MLTKFKKKIKFVFQPKKQPYFKNHNKFGVAFKGIHTVFKEESSFRYQSLIFILVLILGYLVKLSTVEWTTIIISSTIVLSLEIINTSIENVVDLVSQDYNKLAGKVKDIAAGGVLLASISAVIIGIIIFYPKIMNLL